MKRIGLITTILVLVFPLFVSAKTLNIRAEIDSSASYANISGVIVSLVMDSEPEGTIEYSLKRSKDYKLTVSDFSDIAPVEFAYGSAVINYKVDSVGKFDVVLKELTNEGDVYNIVVAVEDPSNKTTKASQTVEKIDNTSKLDFEKIITYIILGGLATILLIIVLIVLIKIKKADNLY